MMSTFKAQLNGRDRDMVDIYTIEGRRTYVYAVVHEDFISSLLGQEPLQRLADGDELTFTLVEVEDGKSD